MTILLFLIPMSVLAASGFLAAFIWAVRSGQYDDTGTPALRPLMDESGWTGKNETPGKPAGLQSGAPAPQLPSGENKNCETIDK